MAHEMLAFSIAAREEMNHSPRTSIWGDERSKIWCWVLPDMGENIAYIIRSQHQIPQPNFLTQPVVIVNSAGPASSTSPLTSSPFKAHSLRTYLEPTKTPAHHV